MFCTKCGKEFFDTNAIFCTHCGSSIVPVPEDAEARTPLMVLKPQILSMAMFFSIFGWQLLFTAWGAALFGLFGYMMIQTFDWQIEAWVIALVAGIVFFVMTPVIYLMRQYAKYAKTEFRFFKNKLEYHDGGFNIASKSVQYRDILEIFISKRMSQRMTSLGDIVISTAAYGEQRGIGSGITIFDIENPDLVYSQIKNLVGKAA